MQTLVAVASLIACLSLSAPAHALNRCTDASGKVTYSDKPCASAEQQSKVKIQDNKGFNPERLPTRQVETAAPAYSSDRGLPQRTGAQGPQIGSIGEPSKLDYSQRIRCKNVRGDYESMRSRSIPTPSALQMEHARRAAEEACQEAVPVSDEERKVMAKEGLLQDARAVAGSDSMAARRRDDPPQVRCNGVNCSDQHGNRYEHRFGTPPGTLTSRDGNRCKLQPGTYVCR
jgi:Domain of unknown function (DUF4124)